MLTPLRAHLCRVCASRGMTSFGFTAATSVLKVHCRQYAASATSSSTFRARSEPESSSSPLTTTDFVAIRLPSSRRRLLRVSGADAFIYLQSLLSNDMRQLLPVDRLAAEFRSGRRNQSISQLAAVDQPLLYAFLLSAVGRVLADLFVYRGRYRAEDGEYILEVSVWRFYLVFILFLQFYLGGRKAGHRPKTPPPRLQPLTRRQSGAGHRS